LANEPIKSIQTRAQLRFQGCVHLEIKEKKENCNSNKLMEISINFDHLNVHA
jgi:hypothetical protein